MTKQSNDLTQVKIGAIFSYLLIVLNTVYGLFVSPYLLTQLGEGSFGVYKTIGSFSATLLVLDLGIGTTVMRYTAKFRAEKKNDEIGNFAAMGLIEAIIMSVVLCAVSMVIYFSIDGIYGKSFTVAELLLAKQLFAIITITMICTIIDNVLFGVITGCNRFVFSNGIKLSGLATKVISIFVLLTIWKSAVVVVLIQLFLTLFNVIANYIYITKALKIKIRIAKWENTLFKESFGYTVLMFIQTLAVQANGNIDNVVIGSVVGSAAVAVYSFGIQMFNMYESLATSFSSLMLPSVSKKIADGATDAELQAVVTKVGRIQFMVLGAALIGFACLGKQFIALWLGNGFEDVYYLSLIMMVPVTFALIENVCLSILRARNLMGFRTWSLIITAGFNAIVTIVGVMLFNYYAAAIGTALSIILDSIIMMNIYYHRKIGFKVFKFFRDATDKIALCAIMPGIVVVLLNCVFYGSWIGFIIKAGVYCIIYAVLLAVYGMNKEEKILFLGKFKRK